MANNIDNSQETWYEKTWLVILLCVFFFPVGLYALWKNSTIAIGWKIGTTAFIALIIIANLSPDDKKTTVESSDNSPKETTENEVVESPKEPTTNWNYSEEVDKMTSKKVLYASITAKEELEFEFPYNGGSVASLTIRRKDGANDIYLRVSKGQFNSTFDGGQVRMKFDQKDPKKYSFSPASDASTDVIFLNATKDIISKLRSSKTLIIETEFFNEGLRQIEFDIAGFTWDK